jgi:hypothetical protein
MSWAKFTKILLKTSATATFLVTILKNDPFLKSNYKPVSILPIPSKKFEKVLSVQLSDFFG